MKNILKISTVVLMMVLASCKDNKSEEKGDEITEANKTTLAKSQSSFSIEPILDNYIKLKNALVKDDSNGAAQSAKELSAVLNTLDTGKMEEKYKKDYLAISDDVKEHGEHIASNDGKIEHQRVHFAQLSKNVSDLLVLFKTDKKLYQDYCPMYDEGKSGYWISEIKEIKNPYYGAEMLTCGTVEKEF